MWLLHLSGVRGLRVARRKVRVFNLARVGLVCFLSLPWCGLLSHVGLSWLQRLLWLPLLGLSLDFSGFEHGQLEEVLVEELLFSIMLGWVDRVHQAKLVLVVLLTLVEMVATRVFIHLWLYLGLLLTAELLLSSSVQRKRVFFLGSGHLRGCKWRHHDRRRLGRDERLGRRHLDRLLDWWLHD